MKKRKGSGFKSRERVREHGEVFTPEWLVKDMCNTIPEDVWNRLDATFLEPACGNGNFLVEILRRKLELCKTKKDVHSAVASIYGVDLLPDNVVEAKDRMYQLLVDKQLPFDKVDVTLILNCNVQQGDMLTGMKANGCPLKFVDWKKERDAE